MALLERVYRVGSADVGVSGLKDRRAVTRQWFSVRTPEGAAPLEAAIERLRVEDAGASSASDRGPGERVDGQVDGRGGERAGGGARATGRGDVPVVRLSGGASLVVVDSARHGRKLRRGAHVANAFEITLRDVTPQREEGDALDVALASRVARLAEAGFPNYLGPQRFGRGGANLARARAWFRTPRKRASRTQRGLWLSSARSALFNRVCAARVADGSWSRALEGEPLVLDGTRSFFVPDDASGGETIAARLRRGDIHPSGPWWGRGASPALGECAAFETAVLEDADDLRGGLERAGLDQSRRALRAFPRDLAIGRVDADTLRVTFALTPGVFATTLLAELGTFTTTGEH